MGKRLIVFVAVAALMLLALAGMLLMLPQPNGGEAPQEDEFLLSFRFEEGATLVHERTELTIREGQEVPKVIMRLLNIPRKVHDDYTELESLMISAFDLTSGSRVDLCGKIHATQKRGNYNIYSNGTIDYGEYSRTNFYLPSRGVKVGEKWKFENVFYELKEKTVLENSAGKFNVVKIEYYGTREGTELFGTAYFDYENGRMVENTLIGLSGTSGKKVKTELVGIIENFSEEDIDESCLLAEKALSFKEQLNEAISLSESGNHDDSLTVALKLEKELEEKKDLNREEKIVLAGTSLVMADDYNALGKREEAIESYFSAGEQFRENMFLYEEFTVAKSAYEAALSFGESAYYAQAESALGGMLDRNKGEITGRGIRKDNADSTKVFSYLFNGFDAMGDQATFKGWTRSIVLDSSPGTKLALVYYCSEYVPKMLPIEFDSNALTGQWDAVLERMEDANKGIVAGVCHKASQDSNIYGITSFGDLTLNFTRGTRGWQAECKNGFYHIELEPGTYTLQNTGREVEVAAARTTIENVQLE